MIRRLLCLIGLHRWGPPYIQIRDDNGHYTYKQRCTCGAERYAPPRETPLWKASRGR